MIAKNAIGQTSGPTWSFTTEHAPPLIEEILDASIEENTLYVSDTPTLRQGFVDAWTLIAPSPPPEGMSMDVVSGVVTWTSPSLTASPTTITIRGTRAASGLYDEESWALTVIPTQEHHPADKNKDGGIDDFELLDYITIWKKGEVGDFELLDAIDIWKNSTFIGNLASTRAAVAENTQIAAFRILPDQPLAPGTTFSTTLTLDVDESNAPASLIMVETLPLGWTPTNENPSRASFTSSTGELKWLFITGMGFPVEDGVVTYNVTIPETAEAREYLVSGSIKYNDPDETHIEKTPVGDRNVVVGNDPNANTQVTATRGLPNRPQLPGATFSTSLTLEVDENNAPDSLIAVETLPLGWTPTNENPSRASFTSATGELRWLFITGLGFPVEDRTITYDVTILETAEMREYPIYGGIKYKNSDEDNIEKQVIGDANIQVGNPTYILNTNVIGDGMTTKTPDLLQYDEGTTVLLTATPGQGYGFVGWTGDIPAEREQENPLELIMDGDKSVTANFQETGAPATHPADINADARIDINELTAYGAAWKSGANWPNGPVPIDINYFTNAGYQTFGGQPIGVTYADGQHWHDSVYTVPVAATHAVVTLYYQAITKEYVEFLRDNNVTNTAGQDLHDAWASPLGGNKVPPVDMDMVMIDLAGLLGDIDQDGFVGFSDLVALLASWGPCQGPDLCPADLDCNGDIGFGDLLILLAAWS